MSEISSLTINQKKIACSDTVLFQNRIFFNGASDDRNIGEYNYDLSSYLPNDDYDYLGYFMNFHIANNSSTWSTCYLKDSTTNYQYEISSVLNAGNFGYQIGTIWFPIPKNKIITKKIVDSNCDRCMLTFLGYQKLNSIELV